MEWHEIIARNSVGQAMQRLFNARGVFKARYSDILNVLECDISQKEAQPYIDYYNDNVDKLKGYR